MNQCPLFDNEYPLQIEYEIEYKCYSKPLYKPTDFSERFKKYDPKELRKTNYEIQLFTFDQFLEIPNKEIISIQERDEWENEISIYSSTLIPHMINIYVRKHVLKRIDEFINKKYQKWIPRGTEDYSGLRIRRYKCYPYSIKYDHSNYFNRENGKINSITNQFLSRYNVK